MGPTLQNLKATVRQQPQQQNRRRNASFASLPILILPLWLLLLPGTTTSYSTGAGGCPAGKAAVGGSHIDGTAAIEKNGSLADGDFSVILGSDDLLIELNSTSATPETVQSRTSLVIDKDYEIAVLSSRFEYKGILIRLQANDGQDVSNVLIPGTNTGLAAACVGQKGVVGITHTESSFKKVYGGTIRMSEPGDIMLDITIVGVNNASASLYGYDMFALSFSDPNAADGSAPSEQPAASSNTTNSTGSLFDFPTVAPVSQTEAPITEIPTATLTAKPAKATSSVPSAAPSIAPSAAPVATNAPVEIASESPSVTANETIATAAPVADPVRAPTTSNVTTTKPTTPPPSTLVEQTVRNIVATFVVVKELSPPEIRAWERTTTDWFQEFYNGNSTSSGRRKLQTVADNYGVVRGSMKTVFNVTNAEFGNATVGSMAVFTYDQELFYLALDSGAMGPQQYTTLPFRSRKARDAYAERLKSSLFAFSEIESESLTVPKIVGTNGVESSATNKSDSGLSVGAIVGICIAGLAVVTAVAFVLWKLYGNNDKSQFGPETATTPITPEFNKEAFSFGGGDAEWRVPPKSVGAVGFINGDTERSVASSTAKKRRVAAATRSESANAENEYIVYAPAGRLGLVLDSPDSKGPVVYVIKENSPLIERMEVGDRLVAVDEVDVRAMTPTKVSKLISKRSANPMRKLTMVRNGGVSTHNDESPSVHTRDPPVS